MDSYRRFMRRIRCMFVLFLFMGAAVSPGYAAEEKTQQELDEEQAKREAEEAAAKRKEMEEKLKPLFSFTFNDVASQLVIIECESSIGSFVGSGFIAKEDGKTYIYTNQHVILGADNIELKTVTGEEIKAKMVELSVERDIARILIDDRDDALVISRNLAIGMPLAVFGNSEGSGVATELYGEVTGVSSDLVEVSADFVSGNSGSPVINTNREIIGIASFVRFSAPTEEEGEKSGEDDESKGGFEKKTRRFCYRLTDVNFAPVNWRQYNEKYGKPYLVTQSMIESVVVIINGCLVDPLSPVPSEGYPDISLNSWSSTHNKMVDRLNEIRRQGFTYTQWKKLRQEYYKSTHHLSTIAHRLALDMEDQSSEPALTGFLRSELEGFAYSLEYASQVLEYVGSKVAEDS